MPEFHPKTLPAWQIPLITIVAFVLLFLSEAGLGIPKIDTGALYMLGGLFLVVMIFIFFVNKWNGKSMISLGESGIVYKSAFPGFLSFLSYSQTCSLSWNEITQVRLTYEMPQKFSRTGSVSSEISKRLLSGQPPNIIIQSEKGRISLPAKSFSEEDYAEIMELLKKYVGEKIGKD